jgi:protein-tyrosine phosphatase
MTRSDGIFRVLVVCTGNTCRSPMVAGALRRQLGADSDRVLVESAGTSAWEGQPATDPTLRIAGRDGVDLAEHRSRRLTRAMVRDADLVLVMEPSHLSAVLALGADPARAHVISEWPAPGEPDLPLSDPYGGSAEAYEECWQRVTRHVDRVAPHIREASRARSA